MGRNNQKEGEIRNSSIQRAYRGHIRRGAQFGYIRTVRYVTLRITLGVIRRDGI